MPTPAPADPAETTAASPAERTLTAKDRRIDLLIAAIVLVGGILSAGLTSIAGAYADEQGPLWMAMVYVAVLAVTIAARRRWPALVAIVTSAGYFTAVTLRLPEVFVGNIAMFIALYTVGAWSADRRRAMIVRLSIIVGMFLWLTVTIYRDAVETAEDAGTAPGAMSAMLASTLLNLLINVLYFGGAYYFGEYAWRSGLQREALEQRTIDLEREQELNAAQAVALDRVRIARELHDVVAHHVSVMGVQAGAARIVIDQDPDQARQALTSIEASARDAIRELRTLLETLRTPGGETEEPASTVSLDDLAALTHASTDAGLPTTYEVIGTPVPLPPVVEVNLYRIAQESLTNARRHAGAHASADVRLRFGESAVELEVVNSGRLVTGLRPGLGQLGMRERALASGGSIDIRPRPAGGVRVRISVPLSAADQTTGRARAALPAATPATTARTEAPLS